MADRAPPSLAVEVVAKLLELAAEVARSGQLDAARAAAAQAVEHLETIMRREGGN